MAIINRKELYKKIWETPITRLSKEYGLSDVGFAKICKKHNIPGITYKHELVFRF
jgi:hypothetical protein